MSTPENPFGGMEPAPVPEPRPGVPDHVADAGLAERFPVWSLLDVLWVVLVLFVALVVSGLFAGLIATVLPAYQNVKSSQIATDPRIIIPSQVVAYMLTIWFIYRMVSHHYGVNFWEGIHWRWPRNWVLFFVGGAAMSLALQVVSHFLPIPKEMPIDDFFKTQSGVWLMAIYGTLIAPFAEELFFRGLLYPALVRKIGMIPAVLITGLTFALIHASQLGWSWAALSVLACVGLALTLVRAFARSLAASVIVHIGYNGFIFGLIFIGTSGFRHL